MQPIPAITITYGDCAENHRGMQIIGQPRPSGLSPDEMRVLQAVFDDHDFKTELIVLDAEACVLVVRGAVDGIMGPTKGSSTASSAADAMLAEMRALEWDHQALMYGRVVEKRARHNLCFGPIAQEPNIGAGRGRVVAFNMVPTLAAIAAFLSAISPKFGGLVAEGNLYYDPTKCGIGYHGDTERRIVVAVRLGAPIPLVFRRFLRNAPQGAPMAIALGHGDMYIMSDKATGHDWKCSSFPTWRHAAGAARYTGLL